MAAEIPVSVWQVLLGLASKGWLLLILTPGCSFHQYLNPFYIENLHIHISCSCVFWSNVFVQVLCKLEISHFLLCLFFTIVDVLRTANMIGYHHFLCTKVVLCRQCKIICCSKQQYSCQKTPTCSLGPIVATPLHLLFVGSFMLEAFLLGIGPMFVLIGEESWDLAKQLPARGVLCCML